MNLKKYLKIVLGKKAQGIVEYTVILVVVLGLVGAFFRMVRGTLESYQSGAVNRMASE